MFSPIKLVTKAKRHSLRTWELISAIVCGLAGRELFEIAYDIRGMHSAARNLPSNQNGETHQWLVRLNSFQRQSGTLYVPGN
jgi:hypothetical protein